MNKYYIIILLLLILITTSIWGKTNNELPTGYNKTKLKLMEPLKHKILINCLNIDRRLYFINDLIILKKDVIDNKITFFLNKDFIVTEVFAENIAVPLKIYRNYTEKNFDPLIDTDTFNSFKKNVKLYELIFDDIDNLPDKINVKIKYHVFDEDKINMEYNKKDWLDFKGTDFWYSRNLNRDESINLIVKTTDMYSFYLNGRAVAYEVDDYLKTYSSSFTDSASKPSLIMFRIAKLK